MIIKKINLENYRSHKNTSIELSSGINLILGENGRGKSSILEAIGNIIFDINDRTGKKTGKSFIRYGENIAKIEIIFIGNDNREYSIKGIFHSKKAGTAILKDLATDEEIKDKENIRLKLNELCGIKKDYTDIYDNIIIAKQNEFINIFKEKATEREKVFNKIFNTELYLEMSNGILKDIEDKYNKDKEKIETEKNILSFNLKDEEAILNELNEARHIENNLQENLKSFGETKIKLQNKIFDFEEKERRLEDYNKQILNQNNILIEQKISLKKHISKAKMAKKSKRFTQENEAEYFLYLSIIEDLKNRRKELENLKKIEENNLKLLNKNEKLSWELKINEEKMAKIKNDALALKEEKDSLEKEIIIISEEKIKLETYGKELKFIFEDIENIESKINSLGKEQYSLVNKLEQSKKILNLRKEEYLKNSKKDVVKEIEKIEEVKKEIQERKKRVLIIEEKIKILQDAKEKLLDGICPLLSENCENVKGKDINIYFSDKILVAEEEIKILKNTLEELEQKIIKETNLKNILIHLNLLEREIKEIENNIKNDELILEKNSLELEKEKLSIEKILFNQKIESKENLKNELEKNLISLSSLNFEEKNKSIINIERRISEFRKEYKELETFNKKNTEEILVNKENIDEGVNIKIIELEKLIEELDEEQKKNQGAHKIYLENINIANMLDSSIEELRLTIKNIYNLREKNRKMLEEKTLLEEDLEKKSISYLKENFEKINSKIVECSEDLGTIKEKIKVISADLERLKIEKEKIEKLLSKLQKLETKFYKTKSIRANVRAMGLKISKYMLESISTSASSNFNKITGRVERILWTNENYLENGKEKENKYAVYLVSEDKKIAFEHLSGGEQVAVAISLRETMTEYFSNSRFIILDEPTNNLDKERKKLLAEYMGEILNNLDQSIIVTHDNSFREMAERIIEL